MGWFILRFWVHNILKDFVWRGIQDRRINAEWEETTAERIKEKRTNEINFAKKLMEEDDFESLEEALEIFHQWGITEHTQYIEIKIAKESERLFDFETPLSIYLKYSLHEEAARIRKLQAEQGSVKVDQTVVQGDQITKTEISTTTRRSQ